MNVLESLKEIEYFIFDVDGVFTNGELIVTEQGELLRKMQAKDGLAMRYAIDNNINIFIITGGNSNGVKVRFENLGLKHVYIGIHDKLTLFKKLAAQSLLDPSKTLYMGDDLNDYEVMKEVKVVACPLDAAIEIKEIAHIVTGTKGGEGCVREIMETVLRLQDKWLKLE